MPISFRWLGIAGIQLETCGQVLLVDPYLTRIPVWKTFFGRIRPDITEVQKIERCDYILVTHSHFDHLLDVPPIVAKTGATTAGSPNTQRLLVSLGISPNLTKTVKPGDNFVFGGFSVRAFPFEHTRVPGYHPGQLHRVLTAPLGARDYRMDFGCCYHISAGGVTFLTDPGFNPSVNLQADILFTQPYHDARYYQSLIEKIKPKAVIPIHWDNLFSQSDSRPYFTPPAFKWPPIRRVNLQAFAETIHNIAPDVKVCLPQPFKAYDAVDLPQNIRA